MAQERIEMAGDTPLLEMHGICKSFGATVALADVDFSLRAGQVHAVVGENGAGKSTLMKILSGALMADSGRMELEGKPYAPRGPLWARRQGVTMIYQELSLAGHLSVEENLMLGIEPAGAGFIKRQEVRNRAKAALEHFRHPEIRPEVKVNRLSAAAQQLVEIARAFVAGCRVLVLDEPTSSLTRQDAENLFRLVRSLKNRGVGVVYISHFIEEVRQVADTVTVLRDGRTVDQSDVDKISIEKIVSMMVGREIKEMYPRTGRVRGEAVLEVEGLGGMDKPVEASLRLHRGEVLGIAGLVGAGRSELLRAIFGLERVTKGKIRVGIYSGAATPKSRWRQGVGMLSENRKEEGVATSLCVAENVTLSDMKKFGRFGFLRPARQRRAAARWIDRLDIRCRDARQAVGELSGGNQQKTAFARLLEHDVDVLLLDEPTRGIDVAAKAKIYEVINELASGGKGRRPKAVLMVSSYLPELLGVCDRVAVMCRGRLGEAKRVEETDENELMLEAVGQEDTTRK
jgi:ribose transport system ATP-binding protein